MSLSCATQGETLQSGSFHYQNNDVNCRRGTLRVKQDNIIVLPSLFLQLRICYKFAIFVA